MKICKECEANINEGSLLCVECREEMCLECWYSFGISYCTPCYTILYITDPERVGKGIYKREDEL